MAIWREIEARVARKHSWLFAYYSDFPSHREDRIWRGIFLFRNEDRTEFGLKDCSGDGLPPESYRKMATRVIVDDEYRKSLLSDDPDLPKLWKRH